MNIIPKNFYLDDFFDDFIINSNNKMKCDIYEENGNYYIEMDVPGVNKEAINIDVKDNYLNIEVKTNKKDEQTQKNYIKKERTQGVVRRSFYIGNIDSNKIKAKFDNGILKISMPKKEFIENKNTIEIE